MVFRGQLEQEGFPVDFSKGVTTETGSGQWGTALSMTCSYFDLDCKVYMVIPERNTLIWLLTKNSTMAR